MAPLPLPCENAKRQRAVITEADPEHLKRASSLLAWSMVNGFVGRADLQWVAGLHLEISHPAPGAKLTNVEDSDGHGVVGTQRVPGGHEQKVCQSGGSWRCGSF